MQFAVYPLMNTERPQTSAGKLFGKIPYKYLILSIWLAMLIGMCSLAAIFYHVAKTKMPDTSELENPKFEESTIVYSADGVEIDRYFQQNRQWVSYEDLSPNVIDALIATEDLRFFDHSGIDPKGTARAIAFMGNRGGASTITQQLALQFFTEKRSPKFIRRVWQKFKEWVIAVEFEKRYTKEEIIAMYLNKFDFNYQAIGIGSAAKVYFGKDQKDLSVPEAATLVGMLNNPVYFNPIRNKERTQGRRNLVLRQMSKFGFLPEATYKEYKTEDIDVSQFSKGENFNGMAPHFMSELKKILKNLIKEEGLAKPGGAPFNLDTDGLKIYTTIDSRIQRYAETAAREHMIEQQKRFERVWQNNDPWQYVEDADEYTPEQIKAIRAQRERKITELVESSELYKKMRYKYLDEIIKEIKKDMPEARLYGGDIKRMLRAEKEADYLEKLQSSNYISAAQKKRYEQIIKSTHYDQLKSQYLKMKRVIKEKANQKHTTTVYTHEGPREVHMSTIDSIKYMASFLQIGSISMDPRNGHVKSWIGGSNYDFWKYDHVTSRRQVGSTFKPFVYTAAVRNGISPCWPVKDIQYTIPAKQPPFNLEDSWSPKNSKGEFTEEEFTLKDALKKSLNSASIYMVKELQSVRPIVDVAEAMGVGKGRIPAYPAMVLGSPDLSVMEMTNAYATFANDGVRVRPILITKIEYDGQVIYDDVTEERRALSSKVNHAMVEMLKHAGSAISYAIKSEYGGKTGTTNDHIDGWFMGITPSLVTGTWVGGDDSWIRFLDLREGQGGQMARPFFQKFMTLVEADPNGLVDTQLSFKVPADPIVTDCEAYALPMNDSPRVELDDEFDEIDF